MSSKKSKKQKGGSYNKKITTKNKHVDDQKSDVLVLPPDLLQKLGINLKNIQSPQQSYIEKSAGVCSISNEFLRTEETELNTEKQYIQNDEKESSILETASLMKDSVFLSPTFSSLKSTISSGVEINNSEIYIEEIIAETTDTVKTDKQSECFNNKYELKAENLNCVRSRINDSKDSICGDEIQSKNIPTSNDIANVEPVNIDNMPVKASVKDLEEEEDKHILHPKAVMESNNRGKEEILEFQNITDSKNNKSFLENSMIVAPPLTTLDAVIPCCNKSIKINKSTTSDIEDQSKRNLDNENIIPKKKNCKEKIKEAKHDLNSANCSLEEHGSKLNEIRKIDNFIDKVTKLRNTELDNNSNSCSSQAEYIKSSKSLEEELKLKEPTNEENCYGNIRAQDNTKIRTIPTKVNGDLYCPAVSEYQTDIYNKPVNAMSNEESNSHDFHEKTSKPKRIGSINNNLDKGQKDIEADSNKHVGNHSCMSYQLIDNVDNKSSESKTPLDKVEEIAFYLSQHRQNSMTKNIETTQSARNSKLCIQGVEKPGGDNIKSVHLNRNIKTYSTRKNLKLSNTTSSPLISYSEYNENRDIDYKINEINLYSVTKEFQNFCICDDFGNFTNYDVDNNYGHIHFWERKEVQCSVETLLSIYEDTNLKDEEKGKMIGIFEIEDIDKENQQEKPNDSEMNICWNYDGSIREKEYQCSQKLPNINDVECVVNNKNEQIDNVETPLNKSKRKRVDKTSESESEGEKDVRKCKEQKYGEKASDVVESSGIVVKVSPAYVELEKEQIVEEPAFDIKRQKKQITKLRKRQRTETKQNLEETLPVEKQLPVEKFGKHVRQIETGQNQIVEGFQVITEKTQETRQDNKAHLSVLKLGRQNDETEVPVLQLVGTGENQEVEVPVLKHVETVQNQEPEMPVLLLEEIVENQKAEMPVQVREVLTLRVKTEQKQAVEVPVVETEEENVTCGVCKIVIRKSLWMEHITQEHNYIAWKVGEPHLDCEDEEDIRHYLNNIIKEVGELVCKICGLKRKFAKSYLKHIKNCQITEQSENQVVDQAMTPVAIKTENLDSENTRNRRVRKERSYRDDTDNVEEVNLENIKKEKTNKIGIDKTRKSDAEDVVQIETENITVKCGVCKLELSNAQWMEHIYKEHDYLAWHEGEPEIDVNNSQQVYDHLFYITKQNDGLNCKKCGLTRRYVKSYLKHISTCEGVTDTLNSTLGSEGTAEATTIDTLILDLSADEEAQCGVCHIHVEAKQWFNHVHKCHAYLAWKEGKPALDLNNEQEVQEYLYFVSKKFKGLICHKCGLNRKYVKTYLTHIESCEPKLLDPSTLVNGISNKDSFVCAVCSEEVDPKEWNNHAMKMHYNIAWVVGDYPVDVKNAGAVEKLLKAYQKQNGIFKCRTCGMKRVSAMGFYVHIIQCGKTEEEIDQFKVFCELCNSKYLCFYKSQHAIMHREQELSKERKVKKEETHGNESIDSLKTEQLSGKRRAAEKARKFIEKSQSFTYNCTKCGYGADDGADLDEHTCTKLKYKGYSDSEDSAPAESSADETPDSAVDSSLSDEEARSEPRRKKGYSDLSAATKVPRIPFVVKCAKSYLKQSADDYRKTFLTNGTLYPQWRSSSIDIVADDQIATYLPKLKESCSVIVGRSDPITYNLFEAKEQNGFSVFVGGCIQAISWAPPHLDDSNDAFGHYLAVACHNDVDAPRLDCATTYEYSGMLQIWDFGDLSSTYPEFALGMAHDYGTVWAIDWCPSGVRDVLPLVEDESESISNTFLRLGLLAMACSNGSAFIFSVPYPSTVKTNDKKVCKLTPVAELRLSRGKRDPCQATSISWSPQNGHGTIIVGYSNGTIALYDLECVSPLLMANEGGVKIFYPFLDERPHSSCITDVKTFPSSVGGGVFGSVSPTGSETALQRGHARIHKHLSSISSEFAPHWPSLILSGNETIVNQAVNELDLWGSGRRTGAVQKCCGCLRCGHMAAFAPPVLKILTTHPAYTDFNKESIAVFQMRPLSRKRPKQKNDELQVKLEPLTYHDAVKLYALDFKLMKDLDKESAKQVNRPREQYPERFPLSDIPSMAFYPSQKHHRKLAVATHAGVIFILTDDISL